MAKTTEPGKRVSEEGDSKRMKPKKGFSVGPSNLPDGPHKRKGANYGWVSVSGIS